MAVFALKKYIEALADEQLIGALPENINGADPVALVSYDSRQVIPGTLFVCKGAAFKESYLQSAAENGACWTVSETAYNSPIPLIQVTDIRKAMAVLANVWDDNAWKGFPLVGITGTKGKSTVTYYLKHIFARDSQLRGTAPMAYLSTVDTFDGIEHFESHLTTPEAIELGTRFLHAKEAAVSAMVMEVSSQALKYHRTYGVRFDVACFLNFGTDHIGGSEHPDLEDYLASKCRLFSQADTLILNLDTDCLNQILSAAENAGVRKLICYSPSGKTEVLGRKADFIADNIEKKNGCILFSFRKRTGEAFEEAMDISLTMPGLFNVENAMAAAIIALELGISPQTITEGLSHATVPGRMEHFRNEERNVDVIVDYAHNELSFEKLFSSIRQEFPGRRLEVVFGCPGDKGLQRREALPRVAGQYADFVWVTEEDPGLEDVNAICEEVYENLKKTGCPGRIVTDRQKCIQQVIAQASPGTVIAIAAKGRENYMKRGREYVFVLSDAELTEKYL